MLVPSYALDQDKLFHGGAYPLRLDGFDTVAKATVVSVEIGSKASEQQREHIKKAADSRGWLLL
ncbi:hypothetical protein PY650_27095 [Rhizobium calliandrae]|uniref:Uncharacterized protein n=1 Tax=Rhizobium calliandrae TaxID=1312182 RepID=A0ABT7KKZ7_9HYPH|nr:hypothetical protein [Rhizobium calliandrae]MDL2409237.1 hypothetical protein [Rhizobium calliandrae]